MGLLSRLQKFLHSNLNSYKHIIREVVPTKLTYVAKPYFGCTFVVMTKLTKFSIPVSICANFVKSKSLHHEQIQQKSSRGGF